MLTEFDQFIQDKELILPQEKILLGISGGIDSMVMLHLFQCFEKYEIAVAHCNFGLREVDSDKDAKFVINYCEQNNIPVHVKNFTTKSYANQHGISIQMAARDLRYNWFNEIAKENKYDKIGVAQHLDDQVETLFINLMRGTGISGIHGILPIRGNLIRPLMFTNRLNIECYQIKHKIPYREDQSNMSDKYMRNYIRHNITPHFEKLTSQFANKINENVAHFREVESFYKSTLNENLQRISYKKRNLLYVDLAELKKLHAPELHVRELLSLKNFNTDAIRKVSSQIGNPTSGKVFESTTHSLLIDRQHLIIQKKILKQKENEYLIKKGESIFEPLRLKTESIKQGLTSLKTAFNEAMFDEEKLNFPLILRRWKPSDSFVPFGMKGRKKLSDFFIDNKVSKFDKEAAWVLQSGNDIIWVVGYRTDNRYKIENKTKNIYKFTLSYGNN